MRFLRCCRLWFGFFSFLRPLFSWGWGGGGEGGWADRFLRMRMQVNISGLAQRRLCLGSPKGEFRERTTFRTIKTTNILRLSQVFHTLGILLLEMGFGQKIGWEMGFRQNLGWEMGFCTPPFRTFMIDRKIMTEIQWICRAKRPNSSLLSI